jgi:hypothetical protein
MASLNLRGGIKTSIDTLRRFLWSQCRVEGRTYCCRLPSARVEARGRCQYQGFPIVNNQTDDPPLPRL